MNCKTCGHDEHKHMSLNPTECYIELCDCKQFEPETKGCGKVFQGQMFGKKVCGNLKLCSSCSSNQSPHTVQETDNLNNEAKPEGESSTDSRLKGRPSGTQTQGKCHFNEGDIEKAKEMLAEETLSDKIFRTSYAIRQSNNMMLEVGDVKNFIKKEEVLFDKMFNGVISMADFWWQRNKLLGDELSK